MNKMTNEDFYEKCRVHVTKYLTLKELETVKEDFVRNKTIFAISQKNDYEYSLWRAIQDGDKSYIKNSKKGQNLNAVIVQDPVDLGKRKFILYFDGKEEYIVE